MTGPGADEAADFADAAAFAGRHTVLSVVVGAPAHGLAELDDVPADQAKHRGVFVPPTELFWEFDKPPDTVAGPGLDRVSWELERFCRSALAADPEAYEVLGSPLVESCTVIGAELRELTVAFLSQRTADAYRRATATDYARASAAMAAGGTPRWGQVAGVIRLLTVGERVLRTGELDLDMTADREPLSAVADGQLPWQETQAWVESLRDRTAEAVLRSPLPAVPNLAAVRSWLRSVRRRCLGS
ncbi:MAG TPA: nucleotidyltransferase domain-containing protein [Pseudonocardiaceae bacterium]|nr:nucleotidyltransferase domain-containing protein [Pseudonocardiaceae bacterium]